MKLVINNIDVYEVSNTETYYEHLVYVMTQDNIPVKAYNEIYSEKVLDGLVASLYKQFNIVQVVNVPYEVTTEKVLNEVHN